MKLLILFLIIASSFTAQAAPKCSEENLTALLKLTVQMLGEHISQNIKVGRLVSDFNEKKLSLAEFKKKYYTATENSLAAKNDFLSKAGAIAKAHPECDLDSMFTTK
jgi:hypothetical protein